MTKPTLKDAIIVASQTEDIDEAISLIQDFLGQKDGGYASHHFSGHEDECGKYGEQVYWERLSADLRQVELIEYIRGELSWLLQPNGREIVVEAGPDLQAVQA